jgi:acyl carrier protein
MSRPTETEILAKVRTFVTTEFLYMRPDFRLADEDSLMTAGVVDSMGVMEVLTFLEDSFGVRAADDEITEANLGSLRSIARYTAGKAAA